MDTLDVLLVSTIMRDNAIDEIRIGTDFKSVISGSIPARQEVKIAKSSYDAKSDRYHLEISSNPGEVYGIYATHDAGGYQPCVAAAVEASKEGNTTSIGPFPNPVKGKSDLKFEIGLPDAACPSIGRIWGNGNTVSIIFSETMIPTTSLSASN